MKKDLLHTLILSCKEATLLIEKKQGSKISFKENLQLKLHLWVCEACKIYEKQSKLIGKILEKISQKKNQIKLDDKAKHKILEKIKR